MVDQVRRGEKRRGSAVDKVSYLLTSVDDDEAKAKDVIRNFYFFLYQLSDVIKPEVLLEYGVQLEEVERFRAAWKRGDSEGAKRLVPDAAIDTLAIAGTPRQARARIEEIPQGRG